MPAPEAERKGYLKLALTGVVSLIVGVGSGLIINLVTGEKPGLEYEVITSDIFAGPTTNLAILAIGIQNTGTNELEDMEARIDLKNAELKEHKVVGLASSAYSASETKSSLIIDIPYFNPDESASIQLLVELNSTELDPPSIDVRAKGATGKRKQISDGTDSENVWIVIASAVMALVPMMGFMVYRLSRIRREFEKYTTWPEQYTTLHFDDQREVFAYILSINGMFEDADIARNSNRKLSYWSHADLVTERCLRANDEAQVRRGIKALNDLMIYAGMADTSSMLVHLDIARMAAAINDNATAIKHLKEALVGDHTVIKKRIQFDDKLRELAEFQKVIS